MADLALQGDDRGRIHHVRDETYFAWRYSNPLGMYRPYPGRLLRRFLFLETSHAAGFLVLQGDPGGAQVNLVDWAGDAGSFAKLLEAAIALIKPDHLGIRGVALLEPFLKSLDEAGFVPDERDPMARREGLLVKALQPTGDASWVIGDHQLLDIGHWDLRMIFSDDF